MPDSTAPSASSAQATRRAAYFDVDGTLARSNIVGPLLFFRKKLMPPPLRELWLATVPARGLYWLVLDKLSRDASNRSIYAQYAGLDAARVRALAAELHEAFWRPRLLPQGLKRAAELRTQGVALVFVTGSIDFLVEPLAKELGAELIAPSLEEKDGRFTGRLTGPPLAGAHKADALQQHANRLGVDLSESHAFGDAIGDLPMLECVGHPVAVNPGRRLGAVARKRGWPVETWKV